MSIDAFLIGITSFAFSHAAPISVLDVDPITFFKIFVEMYNAPFSFSLSGSDGMFEKKWNTPALILSFGLIGMIYHYVYKNHVVFVVSDFGIGTGCCIVEQLGHRFNCFLRNLFLCC